jgi:hypothetical protein
MVTQQQAHVTAAAVLAGLLQNTHAVAASEWCFVLSVQATPFNPDKSSTARWLTCTDKQCQCGNPACGCKQDTCYYTRHYGGCSCLHRSAWEVVWITPWVGLGDWAVDTGAAMILLAQLTAVCTSVIWQQSVC